MWVQIPSKSCWIGWMLYKYVGSRPLQVMVDWLNALQLCGFKSFPSHTGLVECFTAMWVQIPSRSCWIGWMFYRYVGSSPLQFMQDWLNDLQLCGFKSSLNYAGLVECFTAMWVQVPSKSCSIGWIFYSYMGSRPLQVMLDWLNALQLCGFKSPPSHAGLVEIFTDTWVKVMLDWLNALQLCGFKSHPSHAGLVECFTAMWVQVLLDWLNALQVCGFKSPPSHAGLVVCFTATWVQVPFKSHWIGWMLYIYVGSSPLQVMLDWLNILQLYGFKTPPSHARLVECFTAMWVQVPSKSCWIGWNLYRYVG